MLILVRLKLFFQIENYSTFGPFQERRLIRKYFKILIEIHPEAMKIKTFSAF